MSHVTYAVVEHDGGFAYKVGDVYSETFPTREAAHASARALREQRFQARAARSNTRILRAAGLRRMNEETIGRRPR